MPREYRVYLKDILDAIKKIKKYTGNITPEQFAEDDLIQDAAVRNLEIIGEAVKTSKFQNNTINYNAIR
ncbi:MAG: DUF86 domain-containing protein [Calditrichaeota bacterium]|nr:DUF86 domain-containing protein [Calditrichota bacterium]